MASEGSKSGGSSKATDAKPTPKKRAPQKATKAKRKAKPKQPDRPLPGVDLARGWIGGRVDGLGAESIGRVAGVLVDSTDEIPRWIVVRLGPLAGCTALPAEHVAQGAPGRLFAAYARDDVRAAPRFRAGEALAANDEVELCAHWQIERDKGRAAEVADRGPSDLTAVPLADGEDDSAD